MDPTHQQQQSISRHVVVTDHDSSCVYNKNNNNHNNPEYYPGILSPRPCINAVALVSPSSSLLSSTSDERILTIQNIVVRSLRRRLWKSFQEDDKEMALRAYQATFFEFIQWLQQEEDFRIQKSRSDDIKQQQQQQPQQQAVGEKVKIQRGNFLTKRRSLRELESSSPARNNHSQSQQHSHRKKSTTRTRKLHSDDNTTTGNNDGSLLNQCLLFEKELEQNFGGHNTPILETIMNPSEPFIADDFLSPYDRYNQPVRKDLPNPIQYAAEQQALEEARIQRQRSRRPTVAFRRLLKRDGPNDDIETHLTATTTTGDDVSNAHNNCSIYMSTPLHEAARLGAGNFVAFLLAQGGDPNFRNGYSRTALHVCAGGLTMEEETLMGASKLFMENTNPSSDNNMSVLDPKQSITSSLVPVPIEIRATFLPDEIFRLMQLQDSTLLADDENHNKGSSRGFLGRLLRPGHNTKKKTKDDQTPTNKHLESISVSRLDPDRLNALIADRMDATLAILSWVHKETGDGPSINAVDADGRTALHYASGMGRADVCMAILSTFGAMLTIVDEVGARTPCEIASNHGHYELAAQLEARALLYVDPYGLDDDLMGNMITEGTDSNPRKRLVPPFKWFQTLSVLEVTEERYERVSQARDEILRFFDQLDIAPSRGGTMTESSVSSSAESESNNTATDDSEEETSDAETQGFTDTLNPIENDYVDSKYQEFKQGLQHLQDSHVEMFLAYFKWDVSSAMKAFHQSPMGAFSSAGVTLPVTVKGRGKTADRMCQICYDDDITRETWMQLSGCEHGFCKACLTDYIKDCAKEKKPMHLITCPHHDCTSIFAKRDIELLMTDDASSLERLYDATTDNFVTVSEDLKFCPFPGCQGIVRRLPQSMSSRGRFDAHFLDYTGATCVAVGGRSMIGDGCTLTYEGVEDLEYNNCHSLQQPPKAHRFCFVCGEGVHWPITCERLQKWNEKIQEEIGENIDDPENRDYNDLAQKMWIKANTRPCPSCNVNIEKNDGCNHMICSNPLCLHEFCWICRKDWKLHSNATGGFFRCNIWEEDENGEKHTEDEPTEANPFDPTGDEGYGTAIYSAREAWKTKQESNRFIHHYTRWEAHAQSASLERKMQDSVCSRLAPVVEAAMAFDGSRVFNFGGHGLSFVHSAFTELLECRSMLQHSYAFSYFRYPTFSRTAHLHPHLYGKRKEKQSFERLQAELEVVTEQMSDIVARSHLRATQVQIAFLTAGAAEKRLELSNMTFQIYRDEKKEIFKYQKREEYEKHRANSIANNATSNRSRPYSLSELMAMHHRPRDHPFDDGGITQALDGFMARTARYDQDDLASEAVPMWACSRCTYVNDGGRHCAICGDSRR